MPRSVTESGDREGYRSGVTSRSAGPRTPYNSVTTRLPLRTYDSTVSPADHRRRGRRIALLLSAILIPTAAVILLVVRVVRQENELAERRASEQRREALDQLRRELTARLQALRLEEVNRLIGESGRRLPPNSPIVFVAAVREDRLVPPWEAERTPPRPTAAFTRWQLEGESREFRQNDAVAAAAAYGRAANAARSPWEQCSARLWLGRSYLKAGMTTEAERTDRAVMDECGEEVDGDGIPLALYAAERLVASGSDTVGGGARAGRHDAVADYVLRRASEPRWRSPTEALLLQSLLRRIADPAAAGSLRSLAAEVKNIEQMSALVVDVHDRLGKLQRASRSAPGDLSWFGYGEEPWLVTLVSPASFAAPVIMTVSSRRIVPAGITLHATPTLDAVPLGDGFVDLHAAWPAGRFDVPPAVPASIYGSVLSAVLGAAMLAGYLLLRDVHRETATADMRSHFVASVSHELKTPLTSIRAHAETLLMGRSRSPETTVDYLSAIVSESERLTRLVDSVLDFSRIEQGRKTYHLQATRLDDIVAAAAKAMAYPLSQLGFTLTISSDGSAPTLLADAEALTHAILNLLGNAMKYSGEARRIEMRVGSHDGDAFVDVVDHGIGIARDDQSRIFERFHRVQSAETAGIAGTGLGLPLALHVVEAHHGRIAVASQPGLGSTFSVRIPLEARA
jgi:signal transduction histidine kinase